MKYKILLLLIIPITVAVTFAASNPKDLAMFGFTISRNMVSPETGLPVKWDVKSGENIKWSAKIGSQTYGGPVAAGDKVYVGTNNEALKNPKLTGDRGNVMAFNAVDGKFLWQSAHEKLPAGRVNDWPLQGVCSTPSIEGDRLYYISNRAEIVAVDTEGFLDKENDGPFTGETNKSDIDADIVWIYDMIGELDVFPHNLAASSPLVVGDLVYTLTGNGVDEGHVNIPSPVAPSFIAVNKKTGKLVWEDSSPGENVLHGQWSTPSYGTVNGKPQVYFAGGNGWVYAFEPASGKLIWKFDLNPKDAVWELGGSGTRNYVIAAPVAYENKVFIGVGQDPEHGEGVGHLYAIDATKQGDVSETGKIWHFGDKNFNRTLSTVAIQDGLLYAADLSGNVYCLDLKTGQEYWKYEAYAAIWSSPMVADGKVYVGDEDGDVAILKTGKKLEVIAEINMGGAVYTTPHPHKGTLYVATREILYAIGKK
jgi:outer membrane protein assembly factor BamB